MRSSWGLCRPPARQGGFSLLELMVALTILALSLGVLYESAGTSVRIAQTSERQTAAWMLARSILESQTAIAPGGAQGAGDDAGFHWEFVAQPAEQDPKITEQFPLYRVEVIVSWPAANEVARVRLATLRPQQQPLNTMTTDKGDLP